MTRTKFINTGLRRRDFVRLPSLSLLLASSVAQPADTGQEHRHAGENTEGIAGSWELSRSQLIHDAYWLVLASEAVSSRLRQALDGNYEVVQLAALWPFGRRDLEVAFNTVAREELARAAAFAGGWYFGQAANWLQQEVPRRASAKEHEVLMCGAYCDVTVLNSLKEDAKRYIGMAKAHKKSGYSSDGRHKSRETNSEVTADLLRGIGQRLWIELHTFKPDPADVPGWIDRLYHWHAGHERRPRAMAKGARQELHFT